MMAGGCIVNGVDGFVGLVAETLGDDQHENVEWV